VLPLETIPGVAFVERLDGADADPDAAPALLVEVPHGADRRAHYDALAARLRGVMPADLHAFFHVNTDVGAWQLGRRVAERAIAARPERSALLVRCLIPRTFIDCNRVIEGDPVAAGLTPGLQPYVRDPKDRALLRSLHRAYTELTRRAYGLVCGAGGVGFSPHTYAPRSVGISSVGDDIVEQLRWAYEAERYAGWTLRPEVDLLTRTPDGEELAVAGAADALVARFAGIGVEATICQTYDMHPATQAHALAEAWPGRTLCLEVRRDRLMSAWTPFEEMHADPAAVDRFADPIAAVLSEH